MASVLMYCFPGMTATRPRKGQARLYGEQRRILTVDVDGLVTIRESND
jgi:hypothetical protein